MQIRETITYSGMVQGVGFRNTACQAASGLPVSGWVRNEPDGTVRCIIEGTVEALNRFRSALMGRMATNITGITIEQSMATGEYSGFKIMPSPCST